MREADKDQKAPARARERRNSLTKDVLPDNPTVRIIFHGLQCFYFEGTGPCEVGLHNRTHGVQGTHKHQHDLTVAVWKSSPEGACIPLMRPMNLGNPKSVGNIKVEVSGETDFLDGVYVYEKGAFVRPDPPDDDDNANDTRDWRWVIDFERDVYTVPVIDKDGDAVRPSVTINNGLFYTFYRTNSRFFLQPAGAADDSNDKPLGRIAQLIAANIYLKPDEGKAVLTIGRRRPITLEAEPDTTYQIDIMNSCNEAVSPACAFDRRSPHSNNRSLRKDDRNDFYLYYETFEKPEGEPEYELVRSEREAAGELDELCGEMETKNHIIATDEAPCGGSTYGQSGKPDG